MHDNYSDQVDTAGAEDLCVSLGDATALTLGEPQLPGTEDKRYAYARFHPVSPVMIDP